MLSSFWFVNDHEDEDNIYQLFQAGDIVYWKTRDELVSLETEIGERNRFWVKSLMTGNKHKVKQNSISIDSLGSDNLVFSHFCSNFQENVKIDLDVSKIWMIQVSYWFRSCPRIQHIVFREHL